MTAIPVLIIGYNRPTLIKKLFSDLNSFDVKRVYVALDGPKNEQDQLLCEQSFESLYDYKNQFEIRVLLRDYNLGCCLGVISALDWFFSQEDFGAIIEDDCFPDYDFFEFLKSSYNNRAHLDKSQIQIYAAHNPFNFDFSGQSMSTVLIHGWASYAHVWRKIRKDYFKLRLPSYANLLGESRKFQEAFYWWSNSTRAKLGLIDTWDGILNDQVWRLGIKTLIPKKNMIRNLGFGTSATHTTREDQSNQVQLSTKILQEGNLDYLINHFYFRIRRRHILTALFRISSDVVMKKRHKNFEELLIQDLLLRKIILL